MREIPPHTSAYPRESALGLPVPPAQDMFIVVELHPTTSLKPFQQPPPFVCQCIHDVAGRHNARSELVGPTSGGPYRFCCVEDVDVSPGTNAPSRIAKSVVPGFAPPFRTPSEEAIPGRRMSRPPSHGDLMTWRRHGWRHIPSSTMLPSTPMGTNGSLGATPLKGAAWDRVLSPRTCQKV